MLENTATISKSQQNGYPYESVATGRIAYNDTCFYRRLTVTDGLTANWKTGNVSLSGIASFQYINDNMTLDQDFLPLDYFTLTQRRHEFAFTADVVAKGNAGTCYNWLAGAFAFTRRSDMDAPVTFFDYGLSSLIENNANALNPQYPIRWDQRHLLLGSDFIMPANGVSVYHESSMQLNPFTITLGVRWDYEHTSIRYHSSSSSTYTIYDATDPANEQVYKGHIPVEIDDRGKLSKSFSQLLPKLAVSYTLPSGLGNLFASVTKGFKSGGYNTRCSATCCNSALWGRWVLPNAMTLTTLSAMPPKKHGTMKSGRTWSCSTNA